MAIELPPIKLDYLKTLTDDTGLFQHAKYCVPKRNEGYTTDDNARALIVCTRYRNLKDDLQTELLANKYLAFLSYMQKPEGSFHNYLSYERGYLDVDGSEDCMGRALWSLGCVVNSKLLFDLRMVAKEMFDLGLPWVWRSWSLRFYAFTILGLCQYYQGTRDEKMKANVEKLADFLVQHYRDQTKGDWRWFEPYLTYDNARLPQALFTAAVLSKNPNYLSVAEESMKFLETTQVLSGVFVPIGNDGWYQHGGKRAFYDQQPLEAAAMSEAAVDAYYATKNKRYLQLANIAFEWFLGKNSKQAAVYNPQTGGCFDGVNYDKVNKNQGAESSISYLLARLRMEETKSLVNMNV